MLSLTVHTSWYLTADVLGHAKLDLLLRALQMSLLMLPGQ